MVLAIESTEVAEQNKDGRAPQQSTGGEDFAVNCVELEVEINSHRIMMRPNTHPNVIDITEECRLRR